MLDLEWTNVGLWMDKEGTGAGLTIANIVIKCACFAKEILLGDCRFVNDHCRKKDKEFERKKSINAKGPGP